MADGTGTDVTLVTLPKGDALRVFTTAGAIDPILAPIRKAIDEFKPDITTEAGRKAIASIAYKVARSKTYLDEVGKELVAEQKKIPNLIDAARKQMRDKLDAWKDEVRAPLTEWEAAEKARQDAINAALAELRSAADDRERRTSTEFAGRLAQVRATAITQERFGEAAAEAAEIKDRAIAHLEAMLDDAKRREEEAAELERFRQEKAVRDQAERERAAAEAAAAAERLKAEAALKAAAEAAARHERELQEALEAEKRRAAEEIAAAERRTAEAVAQAKREAEAATAQAAAREALAAAERQRREQDREHMASINRTARSALMTVGLDEEMATKVVKAIASGAIPAVSITY